MRYFIWLLLIFLVVIRVFFSKPEYSEGDKIRITTKVISEPIRYETSQSLTLSGLKVYLPSFPEVHYGDKVVVEGVVEGGSLKKSVLIEIKESEGLLYVLRRKLVKVYQTSLPEPHAALVAGITLGSKASLPQDFWDALKRTGTAHVVVASGMNVTMAASFLMGLFILFLPRRRAIPAAFLGIWVYSAISGFEAPIVRAAIMGSLAFSAQALGRLNTAWRALFLSILAMLIIKPDWISDLGFILSVVATGSLLIFQRKINSKVAFVPAIFREGLSTSLAAQIGVAPIIFVTFGQYSLMSPLVNAAVLWTVAPIMAIGALGGLLGLIMPAFGKLVLFLSYPLTSWFVWIVELFG